MSCAGCKGSFMGTEPTSFVEPARVLQKEAACVFVTIQSQLSEHMVVSVLLKVCLPLGIVYRVCKLLAMEIMLETQVTSGQGTFCEDDCCVTFPSELKQFIQVKPRKSTA